MIASFRLSLRLRAPWLSRDNHVGLFGIDAPLARMPDGTYYLPGTLLIGRLAEAFAHLGLQDKAYATVLKTHFAQNGPNGTANDDDTTGRENRRRIYSGDLIFSPPDKMSRSPEFGAGLRTRIALDKAMGVVEDGALQVIEAPWRAGEPIDCSAMLRILGPAGDCERLADQMNKALRWLTQLGGARTIGHGVIESLSLAGIPSEGARAAIDQSGGQSRPVLRIRPHDPICVGEKRTSPNSYVSSDVIAGGVIKGALARVMLAGNGLSGTVEENAKDLGSLGALASNFSDLRIAHGHPVAINPRQPDRPLKAPFSLAWRPETGFADCALLKKPDALPAGWKFSPDWKPETWTKFDELTRWFRPATDFRIRTAIDKRFRSSEENRLFAVEYLQAGGHEWLAPVDFAGSEEDRAIVLRQLRAALSEGLVGVGRGGAFCSIAVEDAGESAAPAIAAGNRLILTLQSPALLRKPEPGKSGDVTDAYRAAFEALGIPGLRSIFVRERLHGAQFFAKRLPEGTQYRPWLLTRAGSCFVFGIGDDPPDFGKLARFGLPIPPATAGFYGLDLASDPWRYCPYLPENGYGEVHLRVCDASMLHDEPLAIEAWP